MAPKKPLQKLLLVCMKIVYSRKGVGYFFIIAPHNNEFKAGLRRGCGFKSPIKKNKKQFIMNCSLLWKVTYLTTWTFFFFLSFLSLFNFSSMSYHTLLSTILGSFFNIILIVYDSIRLCATIETHNYILILLV